MKKTKAQILASFTKANTARKEKMATAAGYSSVEDYRKYLGGKAVSKAVITPKAASIQPTDMVVAFDSTGSMSAYIGNVKKHVTSLIPTLFSTIENLRLKVVVFGDYCDMVSSSNFGKAYQQSQFTDDANSLISFVNTAQNTSGGDVDEFYELVIKKITEETPWREGSNRTVLLIGDCAPHKVGYSYSSIVKNAQIDWKVEAKKAADMGIKFDTLTVGYASSGNKWYSTLSTMTQGVSTPFSNSQKASSVMEASAYFAGAKSGSRKAKEALEMKLTRATAAGDTELVGLFKSYSSKLD